jgi:transcriptional regulator with XRE-family HTH domain
MKSLHGEQQLRQRIVGRFLKAGRERSGLTQQDLAARLSYTSAQFISNWERGLSLPPLDVLPKIATILRLSPRELIDTLYEYQDELLKLQKKHLLDIFKRKFPNVN